jgi:hypothetical protein
MSASKVAIKRIIPGFKRAIDSSGGDLVHNRRGHG